ncbi:MAG: hemolysin III family protein [Hahellaceae bacterium]|nr:hemolysin III family protein [Hahellaceae bacterium]MCP5212091.1 hemolysin III family protein [Hahellaceae bacterium]
MITNASRLARQLHIEEVINSLTHGIGAVLSVVGLIVLLLVSADAGDPWRIVSFSVYGISMVALYLSSTLYHGFRDEKKRELFKLFDHCAIYLLIAGSYTPFLLVSIRGPVGWLLFALVWGLAVFGITLKIKYRHRFSVLRVATYVVMGWLALFAGNELTESMASGGFMLLLVGGLVYTVGVIFYVFHQIPYNHAIWHLFVLGGSTCHYFAIYYYVLPQQALA